MDRYRLRGAWVDWISSHGYTQTATLVFNDYEITRYGARRSLKALHSRLDRLALGKLWQKKSREERLDSISFIENPATNLHYHMLWRAPRLEEELVEALSGIWKKLVPSGNAKNRAIEPDDHIFWYDTKQLADDCFIFSSDFHSFTQTPA